jgi:hypothetical protein
MGQPQEQTRSDTACPVEHLAWYVTGALAAEDHGTVDAHVAACAACQERVREWAELRRVLREVSAQTPAPRTDLFLQVERRIATLPERVPWFSPRQVAQAYRPVLAALGGLMLTQAHLLRRDLFWTPPLLIPVSAALVYLRMPWRQAPDAAAFLAALLAALGMALLYGQDVDPAREMTLATPTSPRLVLGLRCALVFGFDLIINGGLILPFLTVHGVVTPAWFLAHWLAPLCFLSALALLMSVVVSTNAAVLACVALWGSRLLADAPQLLFGGSGVFPETAWQHLYGTFWQQEPLLFAGAVLAALLAFAFVEEKERFAR